MNVEEFREKFKTLCRYRADDNLLNKYCSAELIAWTYAGCDYANINAFVFHSARSTFAFVNGMRVPVIDALKVIQQTKLEKDTTNIDELKRLVVMQSL